MDKKETLENTRKRLKFRSWHRGTKEMDLLLGSFADQNLAALNEVQLGRYAEILEHNDPDLYNWMTGQEAPPADLDGCAVFQRLKSHKFA
jgi:antitoxin CptB